MCGSEQRLKSRRGLETKSFNERRELILLCRGTVKTSSRDEGLMDMGEGSSGNLRSREKLGCLTKARLEPEVRGCWSSFGTTKMFQKDQTEVKSGMNIFQKATRAAKNTVTANVKQPSTLRVLMRRRSKTGGPKK